MERRKKYAVSIDEIKTRTLAVLPALAQHLAPRGQRRGGEWVALNPARGDRKAGSFSINLKTGYWSDFATGDKGDVIALVAYLACAGDNAKAVSWLKDYLGLSDRAPDPARAAQAAEAMRQHHADADKAREARRSFARQLFFDALELTGEDPASLYLAHRGIDVTQLAEGRPRSLRFHPRVMASDKSGPYPALIACVALEGAKNGIAGVHRIYLKQEGGAWVKAFGGESAKEALGSIKGGSVRLTRGASRLPLKDAPAGEWIYWTEGIEDGLSLAIALPHTRILAGPTLSNLAGIVLPPQIGGMVVVRDNDAPGSKADQALVRSCYRLQQRGVRVKIARMPAGFKDVNDVLVRRREKRA